MDTSSIHLPLIDGVVGDGIDYGTVLLVEFEPPSCWADVAVTIAAQALRRGIKTDLHLFQSRPTDVKAALARLGVDVEGYRNRDLLRIIDSYTVQIGIGNPEVTKGSDAFKTQSIKLTDWAAAAKQQMQSGIAESERNRLHIDDNLSVLARYNSEDDVVDYWRTRIIPLYKERQSILVNALAVGVGSEAFHRQFESFSDGIIDVRARDEHGHSEHALRIRNLRGKTYDSRWQRLRLENGEVDVETARQPDAGLDPEVDADIRSFLAGSSEIRLSRYRVVGEYVRFEEGARTSLRDLRFQIAKGLEVRSPRSRNFLLWAPPGSGKTYFARELARSARNPLEYVEIDLAKSDERTFRSTLDEISRTDKATLCLVDEVDSQTDQAWPCEALLPALEGTSPGGASRVFLLAGSTGLSGDGLLKNLRSRPKGSDLLSRIPAENQRSIPAMTPQDRILVAISNLRAAAKGRNARTDEVEKLALYFVATSPQLDSARRLRDFMTLCADRVPVGDERVKFDNLFEPGDPLNKEFWLRAQLSSPELLNSFVHVED